MTNLTRRSWIAATALSPRALFGADDRIASVRATAGILTARSPSAPKFKPDDDLARSRWFGPFAQIPSAILVEIRTTSGLTGFGLGGGGAAAVTIIEQHLRDLIAGTQNLPTSTRSGR